MKFNYGVIMLLLAASVAIITAIAHMSCIVLGPECYASQMAPEEIVESAKQGTMLAPIGTTIVSALFVICGLYALSGASLIRPLLFLKLGIYVIGGLCIVRGALGIQLWLRKPELFEPFGVWSNWVWLLCGLCFIFGYRKCCVNNSTN